MSTTSQVPPAGCGSVEV